LDVAEEDGQGQADPGNVYSMVPRLRVAAVLERPSSSGGRLISVLSKLGIKKKVAGTKSQLKSGDIILAIGDIENPTYKEMRDITTQYEGKDLLMKLLRTDANGVERTFEVTVVPWRWGRKVVIGIVPELDFEHPVIADTVSAQGRPAAPAIPRGAKITAVDGVSVSNFFDIAREVGKNIGQRISIDYRISEKIAGAAVLDLSSIQGSAGVIKTAFAEFVPFEPLQRLYKAGNPVEAITIGCRKTAMLIVQTYVSVRRLMEGLVSRKELSGPVGIIKMSYDIAARQPLIDYVYFLGVISVLLAVFNLLPLPPFDGGLVVLLLVEKVKGSALSERVQEIIVYAGLTFIVALFVYLTFNDIVNFFR
jgi:regulator of sigma E protease